jgi:hypothetical protein
VSRRFSLDYEGVAVCRIDGAMKFAFARFSSRDLAATWLRRMKSGISIARVPMALTVYHCGKIVDHWGEWPRPGRSGYGAD